MRMPGFLRRIVAKFRRRVLPEDGQLNMYVVFSDGSVMIEILSSQDFENIRNSKDWTTATAWLEKRYFGLGIKRVDIKQGDYMILSEDTGILSLRAEQPQITLRVHSEKDITVDF